MSYPVSNEEKNTKLCPCCQGKGYHGKNVPCAAICRACQPEAEAAPELLAALVNLVNVTEEYCRDFISENGQRTKLWHIENAKAAIAKAEGKAI